MTTWLHPYLAYIFIELTTCPVFGLNCTSLWVLFDIRDSKKIRFPKFGAPYARYSMILVLVVLYRYRAT